MLYDVGHIGLYVYVYDSDTGECKLRFYPDIVRNNIHLDRFNDNMSIVKLKMLYGLESGKLRNLCKYDIKLDGDRIVVIIGLVLCLVKLENIRRIDGGRLVYTGFDIDGYCYCICLSILTGWSFAPVSAPSLYKIVHGTSIFYGYPISYHMLDCLSRLSENNDIIGIDNIMCGALLKRMKYYRKVGDKLVYLKARLELV